jgi:hypothetical protein
MKYLCLIYENEQNWSHYTKNQGDSMMAEYGSFTQDIQKSGHKIGGEALQPTHTATTVRVRNGKVSTTDGPFAETKEQLGGFYLLECGDLDEALAWARKIPMPGGTVEVRPVMDYEAAGSELHSNAAEAAR